MDSGSIFFNNSSNFDRNMLFLGNTDHVYHPGGRSMICMEETTKRSRPFFSSPDELFDEEYYDEQTPEKKRRLTAEQVHMLEKSFETENKLEPERKTHLAKKLGLQPRQVAVWFQNRRARWKNRQLEKDYDVLKSSYDSLLSDYDSMVKEQEKLKSEVVSLTDKLQAKEAGGRDPMLGHNSDNTSPPNMAEAQVCVKVEDRLSTGTGASAVVDDDGPQLVDSGNSYLFQTDNDYPEYVGPIDHHVVQSEEEDGSDDGQNYFSDVFAVAEDQNHDEGEPLGWWDWS